MNEWMNEWLIKPSLHFKQNSSSTSPQRVWLRTPTSPARSLHAGADSPTEQTIWNQIECVSVAHNTDAGCVERPSFIDNKNAKERYCNLRLCWIFPPVRISFQSACRQNAMNIHRWIWLMTFCFLCASLCVTRVKRRSMLFLSAVRGGGFGNFFRSGESGG